MSLYGAVKLVRRSTDTILCMHTYKSIHTYRSPDTANAHAHTSIEEGIAGNCLTERCYSDFKRKDST